MTTTALVAAAVLGFSTEVDLETISAKEYLDACAHAQYTIVYCRRLTDRERQDIWDRCHFAIKKMNHYLEKAEEEAGKMSDCNTRELTVACIQGAIAGTSGKSPWAVIIGAVLNTICKQIGSSSKHYFKSIDYLEEAHYYAVYADELQIKLIIGEK